MKAWPEVALGDLFHVEKGRVGIMAATPGDFPLVTTGEVFASHIEPHQKEWIATWPMTLTRNIEPFGTVLFCHATPQNDTDIFSKETDEEKLRPIFESVDASLIICGHTHMQFDRIIAGIRVVNAGSVGMPFGRPGADWLLLGPDVQLRHTSYDLQQGAARIRDSAYPQALEFAEQHVLQPPSEAAMLDAFTGASFR